MWSLQNRHVQNLQSPHQTRSLLAIPADAPIQLHPLPRPDYAFVLLGESNWSFDLFNLTGFFSALICNIIVLSGIAKIGQYIKYSFILAGSLIAFSIYLLISSSVIFADRFDKTEYAIFYTLIDCLWNISIKMFYITVTGRISKFLPEGFESTGVTLIIACFNLSQTAGQLLASEILLHYNVKAGYYGRLEFPQLIALGSNIVLNFICPIFLPS